MSDLSADKSADVTNALPADDRRLYVLDSDWTVTVNDGSASQYCFHRGAGEDGFHLIVDGEVHLSNGLEKLCLNCAIRQGLVTGDRLFWQRRPRLRQRRI